MKASSEHKEQKKFFEWCAWNGINYVFAIPNGTRCAPAARKWMLDEGMKRGVPDIFVAKPVDDFYGLFIEMKYGKNKATKDQREWLRVVSKNGYAVKICYSADMAIATLKYYLKGDT